MLYIVIFVVLEFTDIVKPSVDYRLVVAFVLIIGAEIVGGFRH